MLDELMSCLYKWFENSTLPETNSLPLKNDSWNITFLLGRPIFRGKLLVLGRLCVEHSSLQEKHKDKNCERSLWKIDCDHSFWTKDLLPLGSSLIDKR